MQISCAFRRVTSILWASVSFSVKRGDDAGLLDGLQGQGENICMCIAYSVGHMVSAN